MQNNKSSKKKSEKVIYRNGIPERVQSCLPDKQMKQYYIWDEIIKRLAQLHPSLLIPLVKEIFKKEYSVTTKIEFLSIEYALDRLRKKGNRILCSIRADLVIRIGGRDVYHFECQIRPDSNMVIRMYEYDSHIALMHGVWVEEDSKEPVLEFPKSVILYLTHTGKTPDEEKLSIRLPNGTYYEYCVPVMKVQKYSLDMIYDKKLFFIIPLMPIRFYYETTKKQQNIDNDALTNFLKQGIVILEEALRNGHLTENEYKVIIDLLHRACTYLFEGNEETLKEVHKVMEPFIKLQREIVEEEVTAKMQKKIEKSIRTFILCEKEEGVSREACETKLQRVFQLSNKATKEKMLKYWKE